MPWVQITLASSPETSDVLEDMLLLCCAGAVSMLDGADQPVFEPLKGTTPLWQDTRVMGLFEADTDEESLLNYLQNGWQDRYPETSFPSHKLEILEDKDWEREWMDRFEPIQFGERLWVCPSWKPAPDPNAAAVEVPSATDVLAIAQARCASCHAVKTTDPDVEKAPGGVMLETVADVRKHSARVLKQTVLSKAMPLGNKTKMTVAERKALGAWIRAGMPDGDK